MSTFRFQPGSHISKLPNCKFIVGILLALAAAALTSNILLLAQVPKKIANPVELEYEEGNVLNAGVRIAHRQNPYPNPTELPVVLNPYGPVFYMALGQIVEWKGVAFLYPRLLVVVCVVVTEILLFLLIHAYTESWLVSAAFAALYLTFPVTQKWLPLLRVDFPALVLVLGGIYIFVRFPQLLSLAAALFAAALFTKHTMVAAPFACMLFLLLRRDYRRAARFAALILALVILGATAMQWWTAGHFWFHALRTHPDPYNVKTFAIYIWRLSGLKLAAVAAAVMLSFTRLQRGPALLPLMYLAASWAMSLTAGKLGSSSNHFLEPLVASCLCLGVAIGTLLRGPSPLRLAAAGISLLLACSAVYYLPSLAERGTDQSNRECGHAIQVIKSSPAEEVLTEYAGVSLMGDKRVAVSNPFVYTQLVLNKTLSDIVRPLIDEEKFQLIVLGRSVEWYRLHGTEILPSAYLDSIEQHYRLERQFKCKSAGAIYVPKDTPKQGQLRGEN
jgi:hypothetical protein